VLYGVFRYLYLIHQEGGGDNPTDLVTSDIPLGINMVLWAVSVLLIMGWSWQF
jgi:hypothetical protein